MGHIEFFLRKPIFTFIVIGLLILIGMKSAVNMNVETLPDVNTPVMYVATPLPGGAPEEVEALVTNPLEEKLAELEDVDRITSSSWQNVSIIVVFFKESVEQDEKFKEFREKINQVRPSLPAEILEPITEKISFENLPMMFLGFAGSEKSQYELSRYATEIKKKIEKIPGVSRVAMEGATDRQVEIAMDPDALGKYGSGPLRLLIEKLGFINTNMPGGKVSVFNKEYTVRTIGKFENIGDMKKMVLAECEGEMVRLSDVAEVAETFPEPDTIVHLDGKRAVTLGIMKKRGYGTIDVAARIKKSLEGYPDVVVMSDSSAFIEHQMGDLRNHSLWGAGLVMLVLFVSLGFRMAAIVTFALPMSFFLTFMAMGYQGMTINMVTLFSLLLALGMMVDNSIVVCENIFRHRMLGKNSFCAALDGASEVSWPIFSSTAAIVASFLPMAIFLTGPIGEFTRPISIVVTFALVASLVVANFFNPLMCKTFISDKAIEQMKVNKGKRGETAGRMREGYRRAMAWCLDHGFIVMSAALVVLALSIMLVVFKVIGLQLFPQLDTQKFYIDVKAPAGSTIKDTMKIVKEIEKEFDDSKYVAHYISNVGSSGTRIEIDDSIFFGSNIARFIVDLKPRNEINKGHKEVIHDFREKFKKKFEDSGTELNFVEKVLGPPVGAPICVKVAGDDYKYLGKVTADIRKLLDEQPGVIDLKDDLPGKVPQIVLETNQANLGRMDLTTRDIGGFIFLTLTGYKIGDIVLDGEKKDIFLRIKQKEGTDITAAMQSASFTLPGGEKVRFSDLMKYRFTTGLSAVEHEHGRRTVSIEAGVADGYEAKRIMDSLKDKIEKRHAELVEKDAGFSEVEIRYGGEEMLIGQAARDLMTALFVSLVLIYIILLIEFRSTTQPLIILVCVPYALVGVILGLLIMGYSFSVLAGIGLLCLIGIVVNNGIIYIDYANLLQKRGMERRAACIEACLTRLRPIVLTKLTIILGIMPLALASASKTQFWKPLCWAIIWGLLIATTLTLVIIPVAYYITEGWRKSYYRNDSSGNIRNEG